MTILSQYIPLFVSISVFMFAVFIIIGTLIHIKQKNRMKGLIGKIKQEIKPAEMPATDALPSKTRRSVQNIILNFFGALGKRLPASKKGSEYSKLKPIFLKAGFRRPNSLAIFFGAKIFFAIFLPLCVILIQVVFSYLLLPRTKLIALLSFLAITGFYLPDLWIRLKIARRREFILRGFPDALDLLVVCVEAGMGLDAAIIRVAKESQLSNKILGDELNIYNLEMRAGKMRRDALKNLAMRTDLNEMNNLVTLLIQTEKFGTSVARSLKVFSDTLRIQRYQRAEEMAAKIPVKLIFPLALFIFPSLFVVILGPAAIKIFRVLLPVM